MFLSIAKRIGVFFYSSDPISKKVKRKKRRESGSKGISVCQRVSIPACFKVRFCVLFIMQKFLSVPVRHVSPEEVVKIWSMDTSVIVWLALKVTTVRNVSEIDKCFNHNKTCTCVTVAKSLDDFDSGRCRMRLTQSLHVVCLELPRWLPELCRVSLLLLLFIIVVIIFRVAVAFVRLLLLLLLFLLWWLVSLFLFLLPCCCCCSSSSSSSSSCMCWCCCCCWIVFVFGLVVV